MFQPTVLFIIDDDPDDQEILKEVVKEIDDTIECFTAINGQDGLKKLEARSIPTPTLIFLDINMPRIDGRRFLSAIKKTAPYENIPVIIYTTSSNPNDIQEMHQLGATDNVIKETDFHTLAIHINSVISKLILT